MTSDDLQKFNELKERLAGKLLPKHNDENIWKFLRARRGDVSEAEKMYIKMLEWREENKVDEVLGNYQVPQVMRCYYVGGMAGHDKEGRPVMIDPIGKLDIKGIVNSVPKEDIMKTIMFKLEDLYRHFEEISKEQEKPINQVIQVIDMDGFGMKQMWLPGVNMFIQILKMLDNNYPETLFKTFIINAPWAFHKGFNLIKSFLSEDTKNKFVFLGKDYKVQLLEYIDPSELPQHWGGTKVGENGDEYCSSQICMGGDVPREHYLQNQPTTFDTT